MARFSIRGLLIAVAFVAVACGALKYAGPVWWTILSATAMALLMAMLIIAVVGKGEPRAKAIGFLICAVVYAALVFLSPADELHTLRGQLPTTKLLRPVVLAIAKDEYVDLATGNLLPDYTPTKGVSRMRVKPDYSPGDFPAIPGGTVGVFSVINSEDVLKIGHLLWAMLLGLLGSLFAGVVYRRSRSVE